MKKDPSIQKGGSVLYSTAPHHGEVVAGSRVKNDAPTAYKQKLSAKKGINGAKHSLMGRYSRA